MFLDNYTKEQIQSIISNSQNMREVLVKLGKSPNSGTAHQQLRKYIKENNIQERTKQPTFKGFDPSVVYTKNSMVSQHALRSHFLKDKFVPYTCSICNLKPIWQDQELHLVLDHIDGDNTNNEISNLRWVCPNCNSQLPTFGSRNYYRKIEKKSKLCTKCNNKLGRNNKTGLCAKCIQQKRKENKKTQKTFYQDCCPICGGVKRKTSKICNRCRLLERKKISMENRPSRQDLINILKQYPNFVYVSKMFNVTDNTIRKWCDEYNLPKKSNYWRKIKDGESP